MELNRPGDTRTKDNNGKVHVDGDKVKLRREIGLIHAISVMSGVMIGSGIFISPVSITKHCGSVGLSLIVWALSGFVVLLNALSYTELASVFPAAGAEYSFYKHILGRLPAFIYAWYMFVLGDPVFFAILSLTTSNYLLQPLFGRCEPPYIAIILVSILVIITIVFLNSVYVRYVTRVQTILAATKFLALMIICVTGIVQLIKGQTEVLRSGFEGTTSDPGAVAVAMYSGVFTYGGWQYLFSLLEEVKNPISNVPRTTYISFLLIILIYILTNVAYFTVMTPQDMFASDAVAMTFASRTLGAFSLVIPLFVACSTIGALNGSILGGSRIYFAAARDGLFPSAMSMISIKYRTPITPIATTCVLSVLYVLTGNAVFLVEYLGFASTFNALVAVSCVLVMRYKDPTRHTPIRVALWIPVLAVTVLTILTLLGLYREPFKNGMGVLMVATGIPVYLLLISWKTKPSCLSHHSRRVVECLQKILFVVSQEGYTDCKD